MYRQIWISVLVRRWLVFQNTVTHVNLSTILKLDCCNEFLSTCQDEAREDAEAAKVDIVGGMELVSKVIPC